MSWEDLASDLADSVIDAFGVTVTYTHNTTPVTDMTTGVTTPSEALYSVSASRSRARTDMFGDGKTRADVVVYTIAAADLAVEPNTDGTITDNSTVRPIFKIETSVDRTMREIYTQLRTL